MKFVSSSLSMQMPSVISNKFCIKTLHFTSKKKYQICLFQEDSFDIDNYVKTRGEIKKGFNELFKALKTYTKKPFKIIYEEKFMSMIKPYSDLL